MAVQSDTYAPRGMARVAGALYLAIILLGVWSEVVVRGGLVVPGDPAATAANIAAREGLFRLGFAADTVMALCDVGLAVLLCLIFLPVSRPLALAAAAFRLVQTAIIGANLLNQHAALLYLGGAGLDQDAGRALALVALEMQAHGYDLGLIFFGVNSLLTGVLLWRAGFFPRALGALMVAAGGVYLAGSYLLFLAPAAAEAFQPAYLVPLLAEASFCLWLLLRGLDAARWEAARVSAAGGA